MGILFNIAFLLINGYGVYMFSNMITDKKFKYYDKMIISFFLIINAVAVVMNGYGLIEKLCHYFG